MVSLDTPVHLGMYRKIGLRGNGYEKFISAGEVRDTLALKQNLHGALK